MLVCLIVNSNICLLSFCHKWVYISMRFDPPTEQVRVSFCPPVAEVNIAGEFGYPTTKVSH